MNKNVGVTQPIEGDVLARDGMVIARSFLQQKFSDNAGRRTMVRHRNYFWIWNGSYYEKQTDEAIENAMWLYLDKCKTKVVTKELEKLCRFCPDTKIVANAIKALRSEIAIRDNINPPAWIGKTNLPPVEEFISLGNGLLHLPTRTLHEATPEYFCTNASKVLFDPAAKCPQWETFINSGLSGDQESIDLQQDWMGYTLSPDTSQQKILLCFGLPRSGRGTMARIQRALLGGNDVVAGPTMSDLGDNFGLETVYTKSLAIIPDARVSTKNKAQACERLLGISGEDVLDIPRKNKPAVTAAVKTRIQILTNELPSLGDGSGALANRYLALWFKKSVLGSEDTQLTEKLKKELSGILNYALDGYDRLKKRECFVQPKMSKELIQDIKRLGSNVVQFIEDECIVGDTLQVEVDEVWKSFLLWCAAANVREQGSKEWFGRNLKSVVPDLHKKRLWVTREGTRVRAPMYIGLRLRTALDPHPDDGPDDGKAPAEPEKKAEDKPPAKHPVGHFIHPIYRTQ
jgi:putative DNA primase/helicase